MNKTWLFAVLLFSLFTGQGWISLAQGDANCPGAPLPRLTVDAPARVLPGDANNVRDTPSRSGARVGSIPGGAVFNVLAGPVCADGLNWWQIKYAGLTGWTVEGSGADYWVEPFEAGAPEPTRQPTATPTNPPPVRPVRDFQPPVEAINRIEVGGRVRVVNDDPDSRTVTLTIRAEPGRSGASRAQAQEGDLLTVTGGPAEVDGLRWWQVETASGTQGWVIEGLLNEDRPNVYERTLLALCPAAGERFAYRVGDYVVTNNADGSAACVLDRLTLPGWINFDRHSFGFDKHFLISPDGEYILYAEQLRQNESGYSTLYRLKQDGSERLALTGNTDVSWAAWSPDGTRIAIATGWQIGILNADGSSFFGLTRDLISRSWVAWLPDGQQVIYAESQRSENQAGTFIERQYVFYSIHVREGGRREIARTNQSVDNSIQLSPDGSLLAFTMNNYENPAEPVWIVWVTDIETGERVLEREFAMGRFLWMPDSSALVYFTQEGLIEVVPINGEQGLTVARSGEAPLLHEWDILGWETDRQLLISAAPHSRLNPDDAGLWTVDVITGELGRRP